MNPVPTPYDIAAIAAIPFAPSAWAWAALLLFFLIAALLIARCTRPERAPEIALRAQTLRAIEATFAVLTDSNCVASIGVAAAALKRFIESDRTLNIGACSPAELEEVSRKATAGAPGKLLRIVAELDRQKFAKKPSVEEVRALISEAIKILQQPEAA